MASLINFLSSNKHCVFSIELYAEGEFVIKGYVFMLNDIKSLVDNDIIVPVLSTSLLRHEDGHKLDTFMPVVRKLRGLEEVCYNEY